MKKILIVEDDASITYLYEAVLIDYQLLIAKNDTEAFDLFYNHHPKVVLMDINLGANSLPGNEICKQMMAIAPDTKVIAVSGNYEMLDPHYGTQNGFSQLIAKPIGFKELNRIVGEAFDEFGD